MSDFGDPDLAALLTFIDLVLEREKDKPERQYSRAVHLRECIDRRITTLAAAVHRARAKTPPPRKRSSPILPPAPHSRADTEPHNTARLVAAIEATEAHNPQRMLEQARAKDLEVRDTPVAPLPIETTRRHPKDSR